MCWHRKRRRLTLRVSRTISTSWSRPIHERIRPAPPASTHNRPSAIAGPNGIVVFKEGLDAGYHSLASLAFRKKCVDNVNGKRGREKPFPTDSEKGGVSAAEDKDSSICRNQKHFRFMYPNPTDDPDYERNAEQVQDDKSAGALVWNVASGYPKIQKQGDKQHHRRDYFAYPGKEEGGEN